MSTVIHTLAPYKGLSLPKIEVSVSEEELENELRRAATYASEKRSKETEALEFGDETVIDFTGYLDGVPFPGGDGQNFPLTLGSGKFIPGFEDQLVGALVGETIDVHVSFLKNQMESSLAGKLVIFKVHIRRADSVTVPVLDDSVVAMI